MTAESRLQHNSPSQFPPTVQVRKRKIMSVLPKSEVLGLYRGILREIGKQFTIRNGNRVWHTEAVRKFRNGAQLTHPNQIQESLMDARNILHFLQSNRTHRELIERYWPSHNLTGDERLTRTANTVGLQLPKMFGEDDFPTATRAALDIVDKLKVNEEKS
ncbi:hypothetical protein DFS34DRAFT_631287 [Phlyctochytrium arcticum]|nr:hypothetical protein DFS34DRAFT_631287 [Phlyctochytrium arcticum]